MSDMITIQLVNGENYIGRGYHFTKGDTAEMSKEEAKPFLQIPAGDKKKFSIYDPDMGLGILQEEEEAVAVEATLVEPEAKAITVDPRLLTEAKDLRKWLTDHGIKVSPNATVAKMKALIPENVGEVMTADTGVTDEDEVEI